MRWIYVIIINLGIVFSQLEFSGYVEGELDPIDLQKVYLIYGYAKIRTDINYNILDNINIKSAIFYKTLWSDKFISTNDFTPIEIESEFDMNFLSPDSLYLDNFFINYSFEDLNCTIGRQPITFGGGYVWNPINPFLTKDMLDPTYEIQGVDVARVSYLLNEVEVEAIVSLNSIQNNQNYLVSSNFSLLDHDISFIYSDMNSQESFGFYSVGEIASIGIWTEYSSIVHSSSNYVLGGDYTFENGVYLMNEYLHQSNGLNFDGGYDEIEYFVYFFTNPIALAQDYFFTMIQFPILDFTNFSLSQITNLTDKSGMINLQIDHSPLDDVDFTFGVFAFLENSNTEFGIFNHGLRFRTRYYF